MKTAYLYVRVSTDEQIRKGYSLPEQEDRLLKYCKFNNIEVKGIYREDFSAKNFNRPEWKKLLSIIKHKSPREDKNILFIKWDRFSRNIEYAYEMIGMLRKCRTTAMAIDQPVDFSVPESIVMLAVYLSVPEAENSRRAQNTANGIRRAKLMGRYPNKAPLGFINLTLVDGKKIIAPKEPEAGIIKWIFHQLSKNIHRVEEIRKMANDKGLICSRSHFFRLMRNPIYCGLITIKFNSEEEQMVKGTHEPLIPEVLFYEVQRIITTKRKITAKRDDLKAMFFLRGFLVCPLCGHKLSGSFSQGARKKYPYYHCHGGCKTRINAIVLNDSYQRKLQQLTLSNKAIDLFSCILEDRSVKTQKTGYLYERNLVERKLKEEELILSRARKLFVAEILKLDDYSELKRENQINSKCLKKELLHITVKLRDIEKQNQLEDRSFVDIFQGFSDLDMADKKHLVNLIPPANVDYQSGNLSLGLNDALSKILSKKNNRKSNKNEFH
ncbi:recombinase family protein [Chryseobacterium sp. MEBOG07]|uniref:recombinase family protein n=1 Tax=Chryseobacterium sp. MEBOG07 TaxID=2879939 RepID=UPI001F3485C4|nr:recombinase family protein [Chryseobacterium sp. MEBOG07]UKB78632.1 recombinase family protein [Chryseobacterium sp. MEBOG07]